MNRGTISTLLVEDDERLAAFTKDYLTERGLSVVHVTDGEAALKELRLRHFDVVVLDVMLPGRDGLSVCKSIRERSDVPVLLVTALGEETDRVLGLELGADDYIVKPFSPRELLARLHAFVRRHRGDLAPKTTELRVGPLSANTQTFSATLDGEPVTLSPTEFQLLVQFMERPGRVLSREQLLEWMKGGADEAFDRAIDVQISRLRQKLGDDKRGHALIKTIRGVGYMLVVAKP
jgi:two-component system, OmpR family, response regulator